MALQSKYRGLALPAIRSAGGYFACKVSKDRVWGDLLLTVFTPIGTRPMNRSFGSGVSSMIFSNPAASSPPAVQLVIAGAASKWCPQAVIGAISVVPNNGQIQVGISFRVLGESASGQPSANSQSIAAVQAALAGRSI